MQTTTPSAPNSQRKNFLTPDMAAGASPVWSIGAVTDSALGTRSARSSLLSYNQSELRSETKDQLELRSEKMDQSEAYQRVQLVGLEASNVMVIREVPSMGGDTEVITSWQINSIHRETRLPGSLVVHIMTHSQSIALVSKNYASDAENLDGIYNPHLIAISVS